MLSLTEVSMDKDELTLYTEEMKRYLWFKSGLDTTRNLAVMILFGMIFVSFGFSEPTSHRVPYFGSLAVFALVLFETRLFRFYAASETRIRLMERHMIGPLFDKGIKGDVQWRETLAETYSRSKMPGFFEAIAFRIYKNYFIIFLALDTSWISKLYLAPQPAEDFAEFVHRLDLGILPGWATLAFMGVFWILFILAVFWIRRRKSRHEYLLGY
jgi:uncharacterized membrane protein